MKMLALILTLLTAVPLGAADLKPVYKLGTSELETRLAADAIAVKRHRLGLLEVIRFMDTRPDLFPAAGAAPPPLLGREQKAVVWTTWQRFLDYQLALASIESYYTESYRVRKAQRDAAFLVGDAAFLARYRSALEFITRAERDPGLDKILNDAVPEIGLPAGSYARLKFRNLNVAIASQFAAREAVRKTLSPTAAAVLQEGIAADAASLLGRGPGPRRTAHRRQRTEGAAHRRGVSLVPRSGRGGGMDGRHQSLSHRTCRWSLLRTSSASARACAPGDILLERREWFLSNIGLPGFWPHAALYIGTAAERQAFFADPEVQRLGQKPGGANRRLRGAVAAPYPSAWEQSGRPQETGIRCGCIEAMSEGVSFTTLEHSAACDSLAVLRPRLPKPALARAVLRAFHFAGRPYDFNFDFATDSELVCTELVCKAYEPSGALPGLTFPLTEMLGRKVTPANEMVRQFDEQFGQAAQQTDLVLFLDGQERAKKAAAQVPSRHSARAGSGPNGMCWSSRSRPTDLTSTPYGSAPHNHRGTPAHPAPRPRAHTSRGPDPLLFRRDRRAAADARMRGVAPAARGRGSPDAAQRTRTAVVTRGSGTGLSGGSLPVPDCIVLCLVKMDRMLEVDRANLTLLAEAGATTQAIADAAAAAGLFYPPDPGSMKISTIGGNVAENSGGLRGLKYGVTRNYVMGLEVVLPDGEVVWTGNKCVKDVAGYSLKDLFIGSEGTLGVITKVLLKLIPKPAAKKTHGGDLRPHGPGGANRVRHHRRADHSLHAGVPRSHHHSLRGGLCQGRPAPGLRGAAADGDRRPSGGGGRGGGAHGADLPRRMAPWRCAWRRDEAEATRLATARRSAFSALARVRPTTILEDATVPRSELADMIRFVEAVAAEIPTPHRHVRPHGRRQPAPDLPDRRAEPGGDAPGGRGLQEIFDEAIRLGGTITGEHGIGVAKKEIPARHSPGDAQMRVMRELRQVLDPHGILNPGKVSRSSHEPVPSAATPFPSAKASTTRSCSSACIAGCACRLARPTTPPSSSGTARAGASP